MKMLSCLLLLQQCPGFSAGGGSVDRRKSCYGLQPTCLNNYSLPFIILLLLKQCPGFSVAGGSVNLRKSCYGLQPLCLVVFHSVFCFCSWLFCIRWRCRPREDFLLVDDDDEVMLNVLRCQLTYQGQVVTNAEARFNNSLRPQKPEGSLGRTGQDGHLDSRTAPEL